MNNAIAALPSPEELVKQIKEETIALSLRMKPGTKQYFDQLAAKDKSLSVNNLINRLLDAYVAHYTNPVEHKSTTELMRDYLEPVATNICHIDDYDLLARIYNNPQLDIINDRGEKLSYELAESEMESAQTGNPAAFISARIALSSDAEKTTTLEIASASWLPDKIQATFDTKHTAEIDGDCHEVRDVNIAPKYWTLVAAMLNSYLGKAKELLPASAVVINRSLFKLLVAVVNNARDREDLAQLLVELFVSFLRRTSDEQ